MPKAFHPLGRLLLAVVLFPSFAPSAHAQQCRQVLPEDRPRIGLALGGGGARGYAHIGVLKALEELRIPIDVLAGTSMGSIVGGMTAVGMGSDEIVHMVENTDWDAMFEDDTDRQDQPVRRKSDDRLGLYGPALGIGKDSSLLARGLIAGQKILFLFETETSQRAHTDDFDRLPIPYRAVATDIVTGREAVIGEGALSLAMRASMAVPGIFDPVRLDGKLLVDGGLINNLPVDVVRDLGADVVIAVNVGTPLRSAEEIRNVLNIIDQMTGLAIAANTQASLDSLDERDVLIQPALGKEITSGAFDKFEEAWPLGYEAAMAQRQALEQLALDEADYAAWRRSVLACQDGPPQVQFVRLDNRSRFSDAVLGELIHVQPGDELDVEQLERDIRQIYALGFIRLARYHVVEEEGQTGVVIEVEQDPRGTDFIQTGLTLASGQRGSNINLQAAYLKTDIGTRGSEARALVQVGDDLGLLLDSYFFLDDRQRWVFSPEFLASRRDVLLFDDNGFARGSAEVDELGLALRFGREFGRYGAVYAGLRRYRGDLDVTLGPPLPKLSFDGAEWELSGIFDRLDDLFLPTRGLFMRLDYFDSSEALGADADFEQIRFGFLGSKSFGRHNLLLTGRYNTTLDNNAPVYALFTGGGFLNMSGFEPAELSGQHFGLVGAGYRYQVVQSGLMPGYLGGTIEYGNAAERRADIFGEGILNGSLYFGYSTPLGPLYLGYGWAEDRSGLFFLQLGSAIGGQNVGRR